jgi:RNA polymerase sigma-70 factor (ECF subfamily)
MTAKEYNKCVDQYADRLFRFVLKTTQQAADAEDAVQSAFEKLWVVHQTIDFEKAKSYLFKTAYNAMIDNFRKIKRMQFPTEIPDTPIPSESNQYELQEWLNKGLDLLSEVQKSVVLMRDYEGYSYNEIAEICNLSESQVKVYIFRARAKLQDYVQKTNNHFIDYPQTVLKK